MNTKRYKVKILCTRTDFVRFKELNLTDEHYKQMKKQVNKTAPNGYKLLEIWELQKYDSISKSGLQDKQPTKKRAKRYVRKIEYSDRIFRP